MRFTAVLEPMAQSCSPFVKTLKDDYVRVTPSLDARTVIGRVDG